MFEYSKILKAVEQHAISTPNKLAFIVGDQQISYSQLLASVLSTAVGMQHLGLKAKDKIILSARKEVEFIYVYLAAHVLGITNVIIDAETNADRVQYIETKIKPGCCFGYRSDNFPSKLFTEIERTDTKTIGENNVTILSDDIAEILFTTGTTGNPKGVCLTYANIYSSADNINRFIGNTCDDVELLCLPICHSFGLGRIRCNLLLGGTIVLIGSFANVRLVLNAIEKYSITGFGVVPAAWAYLYKIGGKRFEKYAQQIRYIEIGSAAMPIETKKRMLEIFPKTRICMHYGLTEASRSSFLEFHDTEHLQTIGKPVVPEVDIRIFDQQGQEVVNSSIGELCVKGNMVMSRYLDDSDNEHAFYGDYFRTGDCGFKDEYGYITLLGRDKELINVGGKKVSPMEVEDVICSVGVGDCVCVPIKDKKGILGEVVKCYIQQGSTSLTFEEIARAIADKIEPYKRPVEYEWIESIPRTESGKKQRLKVMY